MDASTQAASSARAGPRVPMDLKDRRGLKGTPGDGSKYVEDAARENALLHAHASCSVIRIASAISVGARSLLGEDRKPPGDQRHLEEPIGGGAAHCAKRSAMRRSGTVVSGWVRGRRLRQRRASSRLGGARRRGRAGWSAGKSRPRRPSLSGDRLLRSVRVPCGGSPMKSSLGHLTVHISLIASAWAAGAERAATTHTSRVATSVGERTVSETMAHIQQELRLLHLLEKCSGRDELFIGSCATISALRGPTGPQGEGGSTGPQGEVGDAGCSPCDGNCGAPPPSPTCEAREEFRRRPCPPPGGGLLTDRRVFDCISKKWGLWEVSSGSCSNICTPQTETRAVSCPAGSEGSYGQTRSFACPSAIWSEWQPSAPPDGACRSGCQVQTEERLVSCPSGSGTTAQYKETRHTVCPSGAWSNWEGDSSVCRTTCGSEQREQVCPPGLAGTWYQHRTLNCTTRTWSPWSPANAPSGACREPCSVHKECNEGGGYEGPQ